MNRISPDLTRVVRALIGVCMMLWAVYHFARPADWIALKHQLHLPEHIMTYRLEDVVITGFCVGVVLFIMETLLSRSAFEVYSNLGMGLTGAVDSTSRLIHRVHGMHPARRAERLGKVTQEMSTLMRQCPSLAAVVSEEDRIAIIAKVAVQDEPWPDVPMQARLLEAMRLSSSDANARIQIVRAQQVDEPYLQTLTHGPEHRAVVESLGGTFILGSRHESYIVWNEPATPFSAARARLLLCAVDLLTCTSAGELADALHERLAAEARLWSYKAYRVNGVDGTDPTAIERATIIECQNIIATAMLASTPPVVEMVS